MKKKYLNPSLETIVITEAEMIAGANTMKIGGSDQKVSASTDIGFVKDKGSNDYDVWKDDWSK
ncbi:MAG: hypothetical protein J6W75_03445 [Bacteroidaceae bacterium]|nr:hypothetical protein [Bacteroidaceae bacterium]